MYSENLHLIEGLEQEIENAPTVRVTRSPVGYDIHDGNSTMFYNRTTTLLNGYPKPALVPWGINSVSNWAYDNRDEWLHLEKKEAIKKLKSSPYKYTDSRKIRGTNVHNAIEALVKAGLGRDQKYLTDLSKDEAQCVDGVMRMLELRQSKVLASEVIGFNNAVSTPYAGTFDHWEIDADGVTWLLDWKTSKSVYADQSIQMSAYQNFTHVILDVKEEKSFDPDTAIFVGKVIAWLPEYAQRLGVVHVEPNEATLYPIIPDHHHQLFTVYRASAHVKKFMLDTDTFKKRQPRKRIYAQPICYGDKSDG